MAATDMHTLFSNSFSQTQDLICDRGSFYEFTRMKRSGEEEGTGFESLKRIAGGLWRRQVVGQMRCSRGTYVKWSLGKEKKRSVG